MSPPTFDDRDARLAALLERLSAGAAIDTIAAEHADVAEELRGLWAAHQIAAVLGRTMTAAGSPPAAAGVAPDSFGDFEIHDELGRGGMGVVYRARQVSLNRPVALKMILSGRLASESDRSRFRAESAAAAKLVHPNIVTVYEVGEHDGRPYFAMEHVEGDTLARRLAGGPLAPRDAAAVVAALADGVAAAHAQGIIHRDIKPSNVLMPAGARPAAAKITDFGLAKHITGNGTPLTASGAILGTPGYMAPEQAAGRGDVGPAADVYALGAILYECLTGRPPFAAANAVDALFMVIEQEPAPPRLLTAAVPRELEAVCLKCLEKSPHRRYGSAVELAADLKAYLTGESVSATPSGLGYYFDRVFRETHHAAVLENWGELWMWNALAVFALCLVTQVLEWTGRGSHAAYLALWSIGLVTWSGIFWRLRRRGGPVRFVERQVAHAWAAGVAASIGVFIIEVIMDYPPLTFSPLLAVCAGMVFLFKAGVLAGLFYFATAGMFATAVLMAILPRVGVLLFGLTSFACFFFPGLKYDRQRRGNARRAGVG
jgi:serine/threonine-protein kinase